MEKTKDGKVVVDEKIYNELLNQVAKAQLKADKSKAYRQARYTRIKRILAEAKAKGIK